MYDLITFFNDYFSRKVNVSSYEINQCETIIQIYSDYLKQKLKILQAQHGDSTKYSKHYTQKGLLELAVIELELQFQMECLTDLI